MWLLLIDYAIDMLQSQQIALEEMKCLPAIKLFGDWIICNTAGLFEEEEFQENPL